MQVDDPEQVVFEETPSVKNTPLPPSNKIQSPPQLSSPIIISQEALNMFIMRLSDNITTQYAHYTPSRYTPDPTANPINIENVCSPVTHPTTVELISKYTTLQKDPEIKEVWTTAFGK